MRVSDRAEHASGWQRVVDAGVRDGLTAGAIAAGSVNGIPVGFAAAGLADRDGSVPVQRETVFDLASLTKVVATTSALMVLTDRGELDPDDELRRFIDGLPDGITLRHLLTHTSGLLPWQPLYLAAQGTPAVLETIRALPAAGPVGASRCYSDLGFILLGAVIEQVGADRLHRVVDDLVLRPMSLQHTGFRPTDGEFAVAGPDDRVEQRMVSAGDPYSIVVPDNGFNRWRTGPVRGEAADCNSWHALDGISGHAGLFSTLDDLLSFGHGLLGLADFPASREVVTRFLTPGSDDQALGWWHLADRSVSGETAYWHSGFTGTRLLVAPTSHRVAVLLTNRLHVRNLDPGNQSDVASMWATVRKLTFAH